MYPQSGCKIINGFFFKYGSNMPFCYSFDSFVHHNNAFIFSSLLGKFLLKTFIQNRLFFSTEIITIVWKDDFLRCVFYKYGDYNSN